MQKLESNNIKHFWLQRAYSAPSGALDVTLTIINPLFI